MVETRSINEDQIALRLWVLKCKTSDLKVSGHCPIADGSDCCASGNVDELPVLLESIENKEDVDLRGFCLLQSPLIN